MLGLNFKVEVSPSSHDRTPVNLNVMLIKKID